MTLSDGISACYGLKVCVPQNSYAEVLIPKVTVLAGGAFEGHWKDGFLMFGISALTEKDSQNSLAPSTR